MSIFLLGAPIFFFRFTGATFDGAKELNTLKLEPAPTPPSGIR